MILNHHIGEEMKTIQIKGVYYECLKKIIEIFYWQTDQM